VVPGLLEFLQHVKLSARHKWSCLFLCRFQFIIVERNYYYVPVKSIAIQRLNCQILSRYKSTWILLRPTAYNHHVSLNRNNLQQSPFGLLHCSLENKSWLYPPLLVLSLQETGWFSDKYGVRKTRPVRKTARKKLFDFHLAGDYNYLISTPVTLP